MYLAVVSVLGATACGVQLEIEWFRCRPGALKAQHRPEKERFTVPVRTMSGGKTWKVAGFEL